MRSHLALFGLLAFAGTVLVADGNKPTDNWPQFRGPGGTGVGLAGPTEWSPSKSVVWKAEVPGLGWACPIVWGDKVFVTTCINEAKDDEAPRKGLYFGGDRSKPPESMHRWVTYCLDFKTGKVVWEKVAHRGKPEVSRHIKNTFASETPATDGERLYVYFGNVGVFCYDLAGKELWKKPVKPHKTRHGWGPAASPIVHKNRLYIVNDNDEDSYLSALDTATGNVVWKVNRDERSNWTTPMVWENEKRTEIVTLGTGAVRSYDLDGKLLWELKGMSKIAIPTPQSAHGLLYISSGFIMDKLKPVYAVKPGAAGDISLQPGETKNDFIAWYDDKAGPYNPSTLVYGDYFYVLLDRGMLACYDARTGKEVYGKQRLKGSAALAFTASPWAYDGKIFCLSEDGETIVIQAGPEFKVLQTNMLDEMCMATPAIAQGSLFIRTQTKLYRIGAADGAEKR